jgi:hypothetical protein
MVHEPEQPSKNWLSGSVAKSVLLGKNSRGGPSFAWRSIDHWRRGAFIVCNARSGRGRGQRRDVCGGPNPDIATFTCSAIHCARLVLAAATTDDSHSSMRSTADPS